MKAFWKKYIRKPLQQWWQRLLNKIIPNPENKETSPPEAATNDADAVPFDTLRWKYGGFDGSHAVLDKPRIGDLFFGSRKLSYRWTGPTLSAWDLSNSNAGALACLFLQQSVGTWVGGKFEWISTSRTTRSYTNIHDGYNGWTLAGIPQACQAAFCIVSHNGRLRTNVIHGTWSR